MVRSRSSDVRPLIRCFVGALVLCAPLSSLAAADTGDPLKIFISDRYSYEDNLFRAPEAILASDPSVIGIRSFDDYVNRLSAGLEVRVDASRQAFTLNARLDDVRYSENDQLDYRGGVGDLRWNFDLGRHFSGLLDARYSRAQAGFSNYLLFIKDLVETQSYIGELRFEIGSRWALLGGATFSESTHSAIERQTSNYESESGRVGIEYSTPTNSLIAFDFAYTEATFPVAERLYGMKVGFEQTLPGVRLRYVLSEKTRISARGGYLKRDYSNPSSGDYSGNVWNIQAYWEPRRQIYFDFELYHELKAYSDAEADYFVAQGVSLTPTWAPTPTMKLALGLTFEDQSYRAAATPESLPQSGPGREDDVKSASLTWSYTPRDFLSVELAYRWVDRDSNRELRRHEAEVASAQLRIVF
jgi:hypothetical protein